LPGLGTTSDTLTPQLRRYHQYYTHDAVDYTREYGIYNCAYGCPKCPANTVPWARVTELQMRPMWRSTLTEENAIFDGYWYAISWHSPGASKARHVLHQRTTKQVTMSNTLTNLGDHDCWSEPAATVPINFLISDSFAPDYKVCYAVVGI